MEQTIKNYDKPEFEIEGTVLKEYKGNGQDVTIPYVVKIIDEDAFLECSGLTH